MLFFCRSIHRRKLNTRKFLIRYTVHVVFDYENTLLIHIHMYLHAHLYVRDLAKHFIHAQVAV